jgi:voltage-gated potassium channel
MNNNITLFKEKIKNISIVFVLVYLICTIGLILIPGVDDNGNKYNMELFDAFYIVSYTGLTIGFGELPYEWTRMQRIWMLITSYSTVILWVLAITKFTRELKNPNLMHDIHKYFFKRKINKLKDEYYIIFGYGNKGKNILKYLASHDIKGVIIEKNPNRISEILIDNINRKIKYYKAKELDADAIETAGYNRDNCRGVILALDDDSKSIELVTLAKIINKRKKIVATTYNDTTAKKLKAIDCDYVIEPHKIVINTIKNCISNNKINYIYNMLTEEHYVDYVETIIPNGSWIISGEENYCTLASQELNKLKVSNEVVKSSDKILSKESLIATGIKTQKVMAVLYSNDHKNLYNITIAKTLNENITVITIANNQKNINLYKKIGADIIFQPHKLTTKNINYYLSEPLIKDYFHTLSKLESNRVEPIYEKIKEIYNSHNKDIKTHSFKKKTTEKEIISKFYGGEDEYLVLMIKRGKEKIFMPKESFEILKNDIILYIGK